MLSRLRLRNCKLVEDVEIFREEGKQRTKNVLIEIDVEGISDGRTWAISPGIRLRERGVVLLSFPGRE
jgi:hypothetical protein